MQKISRRLSRSPKHVQNTQNLVISRYLGFLANQDGDGDGDGDESVTKQKV